MEFKDGVHEQSFVLAREAYDRIASAFRWEDGYTAAYHDLASDFEKLLREKAALQAEVRRLATVALTTEAQALDLDY